MPPPPNMCSQLVDTRKLEKKPFNTRYDACHECRKKKFLFWEVACLPMSLKIALGCKSTYMPTPSYVDEF
jgi:hypothetical protein